MNRELLFSLVVCGCSAAGIKAATYEFQHKLMAFDGARDDRFGYSVAASRNVAIVGSPLDADNGTASGSAYLFDPDTGILQHKLTAPDGAPGDRFGYSVATTNDTALIGSWRDDDKGENSGSAYLYDATTGSLLHKLTAPDGSASDFFGAGIDIKGNQAIVGSHGHDEEGENTGAAYLYDTTTGKLAYKLTAPDRDAYDSFGFSVALAGDLALVGSRRDDDKGEDSGAAYLFDTTTRSLLHKLTAPDGRAFDYFGTSVALGEDVAIVGSPSDDDDGRDSGAAYVFDIITGNMLHKLTAPDGDAFDAFGRFVALADGKALIGSFASDGLGRDSGSAYLFDTVTGNLLEKFAAPDGVVMDYFGHSVAFAGDTALIGKYGDGDALTGSGSAYLFRVVVPEPTALMLSLLAVGIGSATRRTYQRCA